MVWRGIANALSDCLVSSVLKGKRPRPPVPALTGRSGPEGSAT